MSQINPNHTHIGDGVYASFNGFQIELRVNDHRTNPLVFLEPEVMDNLIKYYNSIIEQAVASVRADNKKD